MALNPPMRDIKKLLFNTLTPVSEGKNAGLVISEKQSNVNKKC